MKVLIVDDSDAARKQLRTAVEALGHSAVGVACNGEEAVARYRELRPDVVIMDMIMPRLNGLEALREILAYDSQARVVMTCSLKSCEMAFASEQHGARFFLVKPFEDGCIRKVLAKLAAEVSGGAGNGNGLGKASPPCSDPTLVSTPGIDPPRPARTHTTPS
jgi:two-component system chemotaxis response regulator CheY